MSDWNEAIMAAQKMFSEHETIWTDHEILDMLELLKRPAPLDGGWMPIESAPKDGTLILGYQAPTEKYAGRMIVMRADDIWANKSFKNPDYWIPLPPAPSTEKAES